MYRGVVHVGHAHIYTYRAHAYMSIGKSHICMNLFSIYGCPAALYHTLRVSTLTDPVYMYVRMYIYMCVYV